MQSLRAKASRRRIQNGSPSYKAIDRELRSMTELRIRPGSAFYYDTAFVLTVLDVVVNQSTSMLIMY